MCPYAYEYCYHLKLKFCSVVASCLKASAFNLFNFKPDFCIINEAKPFFFSAVRKMPFLENHQTTQIKQNSKQFPLLESKRVLLSFKIKLCSGVASCLKATSFLHNKWGKTVFSELIEDNRIPEGLGNDIFEDSSPKVSSGKLSRFSIFWVCPPILDIYS